MYMYTGNFYQSSPLNKFWLQACEIYNCAPWKYSENNEENKTMNKAVNNETVDP